MPDQVFPQIVSDPEVMMGKPVIAGTRLAVEMLLEDLASGMTVEEMLDAYPRLTHHSLRAALAYAAWVLHDAHDSRVASA